MTTKETFHKYDQMAGFPIFTEFRFLGTGYVETLTHFKGKKLSELLLNISKKFPDSAREMTVRIMINNPGRLAGYLN